MSPMGKGLQSWLCAYTANTSNNITGAPVAQGNYVTSSPGVLTGNLGYKMYLSNAIYSFYAVSCNSTSPAPTFTNGLSEPLSNGVDYLWWHAVHQDIASSQVNIPITYQHAATQVVVAIAGGENITLNKILSLPSLRRNRAQSWTCQQVSSLRKSAMTKQPIWESTTSPYNISCYP